MRVGSGVILFQLAGFLTSALADFYFAKHTFDSSLVVSFEKFRIFNSVFHASRSENNSFKSE